MLHLLIKLSHDLDIIIDDQGNKTIHEEVIINGDEISIGNGKAKTLKWVNDNDSTSVIKKK